MKTRRRLLAPAMIVLLLSGCVLGPDYQRPPQKLPESFTPVDGWKQAEPAELRDKGAWWVQYEDELLAQLLRELDGHNQDLSAAESAWRASLATTGVARAGLFPQLDAQAGSVRRDSEGVNSEITESKTVQLGLAWELDLWGKVRRQLEAAEAGAQASAADWMALRLSLQTRLVQNYIQLRALDEQRRIVQRNLDAYERVLRITSNRYQTGLVTKADVSQALTQFKSTEAQLLDLASQRQVLLHAIAVLLGKPATSFTLSEQDRLPQMPALPHEIPSSLLERRPDVAAAERRVIAANAEIGVARAAYFPSFSFSAGGGYRAAYSSGLIDTANRFWSIGPQLDLPIFDAGARRARSRQVQHLYDQQVASYRQTTLQAIAEVEDELARLLSLQDEYLVQAQANEAAQEALTLIENQYLAGLVDFVSVSNAQTTALNAERTLLQLQTAQLEASARLISALGGGWQGLNTPAGE